jgi:hypothetical protein
MRSKLAMGGLILGAAWGAYRRLRSPISLQCSYGHARTKILIIGGGFGGGWRERSSGSKMWGSPWWIA